MQRRHDPAAVERILRALPAWFGIEDSLRHYVVDAAMLPSYLAVQGDRVIGAALVARHFPSSAEIHLIAVDPAAHRRGVGSALIATLTDDLRADGCRVLQVHTVGPSHPSPEYARTREFYLGLGFLPLQEFGGLDWDGPTLVLVKPL